VVVLKSPSRRPAKGSAELEKFLRAATIAAKESASKRPSDNMTSEQELVFRRERNRVMAKQTRERKKIQFKAMQDQLQSLRRENQRLKGVVKHYVKQPKTILKDCTALAEIPKEVWESFAGGKTPFLDQDDDDEEEDCDSSSSTQRMGALVQDPTNGGHMLLDLTAVLPTFSASNPLAISAMKSTHKCSSVVSDDSVSSSVPNPLDATR